MKPKTYLIGYTNLNLDGLKNYLKDTDQEDFLETLYEAEREHISPGEILCSFYAKLCYKSLVIGKNKNISRTRDIEANIKSCMDTGHGSVFEHCWLNFVTTNCSRVFTHELVRHRVGTAFCLSGDTEVWSGTKINGRFDGVRKKWTLKQLYDWSLDKKRKGRLKLIKVRCFNGTEFIPANIKNIIQSGIKDIYLIELENGKTIKSSKDHKFLTINGWNTVENLTINDELATNGVRTGLASTKEKEDLRRYKISMSKVGKLNPNWLGDNVGAGGARRRSRKFKLDSCEECSVNTDLQVHHKDRNLLNNQKENLNTLCNSCHQKLHNKEDGNPNALIVKFSRIKSIQYIGKEMTYDLEVDHESHNFVANGIVTHNSQTSGRYVAIDQLDLVIDPILEPASELIEKTRKNLEDNLKELRKWLIEDPDIKDFGTKKKITSAIRRLAPNGQTNEIGWSCNIRSLRHLIEMRTGRHAEWEIRLIFNQVADLVKDKFPTLLYNAKIEEVDGLLEYSNLHI